MVNIDFDAYGMNQALGVDFMSAFLFGLSCSSNFIQDVFAFKKLSRDYEVKKQNEAKVTQILEDFDLSMCQKAGSSTQSTSTSGIATQPIVFAQLSSQISKTDQSQEKRDLIVASEMFDHLAASIETTTITMTYL